MQAFQDRDTIRISVIAELKFGSGNSGEDKLLECPSEEVGTRLNFNFDRLGTYVDANATILPYVVRHCENADTSRSHSKFRPRTLLWKAPLNDVGLLMYTVDVPKQTSVGEIAKLVNECFESNWGDHAASLGIELTTEAVTRAKYALVFVPRGAKEFSKQDEQKIIYRADLPADLEYVKLTYPDELNRRIHTGAVLGPLTALLWGQQDYVENLVTLSAVMTVASAAGLRRVQESSYREMLKLRSLDITISNRDEIRGSLNAVSGQAAELEDLLVRSADAGANLFPFIPSLRPADFHRSLWRELRIDEDRVRAERFLRRLTSVADTRKYQLASIDNLQRESRSKRWAFSVAAASTIAIPVSILLAFFGITGTDIDPNRSVFDIWYYWWIYLTVISGIVVIALLHGARAYLDRRAFKQGQEQIHSSTPE